MNLNLEETYAILNNSQTYNADLRIEKAIELAACLLEIANKHQSREEYKQMAQLSRLIDDPKGKAFTCSMTDECFRSNSHQRIANQINHLLKFYGTPKYLNTLNRLQMDIFKRLGDYCGSLLIPLIKKIIRKETSRVILPGEEHLLKQHLIKRKSQGITTNLNHLGEAILGEKEALLRLKTYLDDLKKPEIEYISVKVSTIYSQLNMIDQKATIEILKDRLRLLYREAMQSRPPKFVNLDMEEYRDLHLTINSFKEVLSEKEFIGLKAGIVLQAYLPDSFKALQELTEWASLRFNESKTPIKIRLVKGANLAMEKIEASQRGWPQAPFPEKIQVDAHYRKMINYSLEPNRAKAVNIGVASHNIFDIAYALILKYTHNLHKYVNFEMLEGMAEHLRLVVQELSEGMILYCPAAGQQEFQNAIAYLIRRLDENTAQDNFLRHLFDLKPNSKAFKEQADFFRNGSLLTSSIDSTPNRKQDRNAAIPARVATNEFSNEADTDFAITANFHWSQKIYDSLNLDNQPQVPLCIDGKEMIGKTIRKGHCPDYNCEWGKISLALEEDIKTALNCASENSAKWCETPLNEKVNILKEAAQLLRLKRAELIQVMIMETAKTLSQADTEISEAVDFCEFYSSNIREWHKNGHLEFESLGPVLITSPWNFPCAIPIGGICAALCTGNSVIFKPAPEAAITGWALTEIFYLAGVPKKVLQFINCEDDPTGSLLIKSPLIKACILTGATETAQLFMKMNPCLNLMAETGGKNCFIATALCDRDLFIKDLVNSAFGHAGQKCSACSLAILEKEVYEDNRFLHSLKDAAESLQVGLASWPGTMVNPLIKIPDGKLKKALTTLEEGESWLLKPEPRGDTPHLWSPGIKLGVRPGSFTFKNEFFGPVLGLVKADDLNHAIQLANSLDYGLTAGIHSLDKREQKKWLSKCQVGNAYINRGITGAIVNRQPFGGYKNSAYGRGFKAGGPNYLLQLMKIKEIKSNTTNLEKMAPDFNSLTKLINDCLPDQLEQWHQSTSSYLRAMKEYFTDHIHHGNILGQDNFTLYRPEKKVRLFVQKSDSHLDLIRSITASFICNTPLETIIEDTHLLAQKLIQLNLPKFSVSIIHKSKFPDYFLNNLQGRNRLISAPPQEWLNSAAKKFAFVQANPVFAIGRLELLHYLRAISVSDNFHRYGNLGNKTKY